MLILIWKKTKHFVLDLNIRNKLFISFLLVFLLPLIIIGTLTYQKSSSLIQERTNDYTTDLLDEVSRNIELNMREIDRLYYSIFTNQVIRDTVRSANSGLWSNVDYLSASKRLSSILYSMIIDREDVAAVNLYTMKKLMFQAGSSPYSVNLNDEEWKKMSDNKGDLIWISPESDPFGVAAVSSIYDTGSLQKIGYFILSYKEEALYSVYSRTKLHDQGELFIVDSAGEVISHKDKSLLHTHPAYTYLDKILRSSGRGNWTEKITGKMQVVSYQSIGGTDWKIVSVIPTAKYSDLSIQLKSWMIILFAIFTIFGLVLSYFIAAGISRPIRRLSAMMKNVERERWDVAFDYHSRDEIGILGLNFNRMIGRIRYLINQVYQEELMRQRSQLKYLMFQINPHFLFNTLETINWLARMKGAPEVGKLTKALGDLMREGIKGKEFISLESEVESLCKYIYIQKYRYEDKFEVHFDIEPQTLRVSVPRFILQPLVENAIVHGMEMKADMGIVLIRTEQKDGILHIEVTDDGLGMDADQLAKIQLALAMESEEISQGIGLANVYQRIRLHYGKAYGLSIVSKPAEGTLVRITLPAK